MSKQRERETRASVTLTFGPDAATVDPLYDYQVIQLTADLLADSDLTSPTVTFNVDAEGQPGSDVIRNGLRVLDPNDAHSNGKDVPMTVDGANAKHATAQIQGVVISKAGSGVAKLNGSSSNPTATNVVPQAYDVEPTELVFNSGITGYLKPSATDGTPADSKTCFNPLSYYIGIEGESGLPTQINNQMFSKIFFTQANAFPENIDNPNQNLNPVNDKYFQYFNIVDEQNTPIPLIDDPAFKKKICLSGSGVGTFPTIYVCPKAGVGATKPIACTLWVEASGDINPAGDIIIADLLHSTDPSLPEPRMLYVNPTIPYQIPQDTTTLGVIIPQANGPVPFEKRGSIYLFVNGQYAYSFTITDPTSQFRALVPNTYFPVSLLNIPSTPNDPPTWNQITYVYIGPAEVEDIHVGPAFGFKVAYSGEIITGVQPPNPTGDPGIVPPYFPDAEGEVGPEICYDGLRVQVDWANTALDGLLQDGDVLQFTLYMNGYVPGTNKIQATGNIATQNSPQITIAGKAPIIVTFPYSKVANFGANVDTGELGSIQAQYSIVRTLQTSQATGPIPFESSTVGSEQGGSN